MSPTTARAVLSRGYAAERSFRATAGAGARQRGVKKLNRNPRDLRLSTETLRALSQSQLLLAAGGTPSEGGSFMLVHCCSAPVSARDGQ
jgi:hypothetical protein